MIFRIEKKSVAEPAYARFCRSDARANYYIFSEEDPINIYSFTLDELIQLRAEIQKTIEQAQGLRS